MNNYLCSNLAKEIDNDYYVAYILLDNNYFYNTVFQILKKNNENCFIKPYKVNYNGMVKLVYDTENLTNIVKYFKKVKVNEGMLVIEKLIDKLIELGRNSFIQVETIDVTHRHVYIDEDGNIQLICVPISIMSDAGTRMSFDNSVKSLICYILQGAAFVIDENIKKLILDCQDINISIEDISSNIKSKKYGVFDLQYDEQKNSTTGAALIFGYYILESDNRTAYSDIIINSNKMVIGTSEMEADYIIHGANAVSRRHCELVISDSQLYIRDLESTNGTYVNGMVLTPNNYVPLSEGDRLAIANNTYVVTGGGHS